MRSKRCAVQNQGITLNRVKSVFLMYFSAAFKGVLTCLKRY